MSFWTNYMRERNSEFDGCRGHWGTMKDDLINQLPHPNVIRRKLCHIVHIVHIVSLIDCFLSWKVQHIRL